MQDRRATTTRPEQATVPRVFKPLPANASFEQLLHSYQEMSAAYATIAAAFAIKLPAMEERHTEFEFIQRGHGRRLDDLEVWRQQMETKSLPPMRGVADSVNEIVEHLSATVKQRVEAEFADTTTPPPDAEKVASINKDVMAAALNQIKAEWWDKLEAERKANEDDRRALVASNIKEMSKFKWAAALSAITAAITVGAWLIEHFVGGK